MMSTKKHDTAAPSLEAPLAPKKTRLEEAWHLFKKNRLAIAGMIIFMIFFATALIGLALTSGSDPLLDPAQIRLQEKLLPPFSKPNLAISEAP